MRAASRRRFLAGLAGWAGALSLAPRALAAAARPSRAGRGSSPAGLPAPPPARADGQDEEPEALFGLSLAQWSLHRAHLGGAMTILDFPAAARGFGLDAVEYVNLFFEGRATEAAFLRELRERARDAGVTSRLIMVDGEGELADEDESARRRAIENHFKWIAAIAFLDGTAIRVNAAGRGPREEVARRAADSLHRLAELADPYGVDVIVENHGGLSSDGAWLAGVMEAAAHPRVGTLPDFGNFGLGDGREYDRYQGVAELMPWARAVSAKSYDFDEHGEETTIDYGRMLAIVVDAGYRGPLGIEYEGERLSEPDGIRATKALLERVRAGLARR